MRRERHAPIKGDGSLCDERSHHRTTAAEAQAERRGRETIRQHECTASSHRGQPAAAGAGEQRHVGNGG